jgi:hypothetical protein
VSEPTGPSELLFLAANVLDNPEERHPGWLHMASVAGAMAPLSSWLRAEAVFAGYHETAMDEAVAFARSVLAWGNP